MAPQRLEEVTNYVDKNFDTDSIDRGIARFNKCVDKLNEIEADRPEYNSQKVENFEFLVRKTLLEVFGELSFEYQTNQKYKIFQPRFSIYHDLTPVNQKTFIAKLPESKLFLESFIEHLEDKRIDITSSPPEKRIPLNLWSLFHPKVTAVAKSRFDSKNYADAVEAVFKEINSVLKTEYHRRTGRELDGYDLMMQSFKCNLKSNPPEWPVIPLNNLRTESDKNIQNGFQFIFAGALQAIRNPKTHENVIIDEERCIHFLMLGSLLFHKLEEARVIN